MVAESNKKGRNDRERGEREKLPGSELSSQTPLLPVPLLLPLNTPGREREREREGKVGK